MEFEEKHLEESTSESNKSPKEISNETEFSIYETDSLKNKSSTDLENLNFNFSATDKKLCFIGNDSASIPTEIIYEFGLKTLILDISFNFLSDLSEVQQFPYLEELICDNNEISENTNFPKLENLKILSCNKNKIKDIHVFIDKIKILFPNLIYLSLLGNVACPNQLIDPNKDDYDYSRYRKYILHRLRNLKFLDCYEVTREEKEMIRKDSLFYEVVKAKDDSKANNKESENVSKGYTPLPDKASESKKSEGDEIEEIEEEKPQGSFGYCRYVYYGKQSEGNRFIKNDDL